MYRLDDFMMDVERRNPSEPEFIQAVREVVESVIDTVNDNPRYIQNRILERITEPDRVISFKVEWEDDDGNIRVNRGYRVQFNNALGPYKGGLRFHASSSHSSRHSRMLSLRFRWEEEREVLTSHRRGRPTRKSSASARRS